MPRIASLLALAAFLSWTAVAEERAELPDWQQVAEVDTVQVLTENEDGAVRNTRVWLAVVDGQGYIRTGGSSWGENVERDPDVRVRIGGTEYALHALFVEDDELRERIVAAFREKYGFSDALVGLFRGARPKIMRLTAR